jgi:hypothetical protein
LSWVREVAGEAKATTDKGGDEVTGTKLEPHRRNQSMTTTNTVSNGTSRKNLASQLDRLDQILDGLADGLNDAVANAVKEAVTVAVQEAIRSIVAEVLTNGDLLTRLRAGMDNTTAPASRAKPALAKRAVAKVNTWLGIGWRSIRTAFTGASSVMMHGISRFRQQMRLVRQFKVPLALAVIVGVVAGIGAYSGGPYIAAFAGWLAGFTTTLTVQAGIWLRRAFGGVGTDCA